MFNQGHDWNSITAFFLRWEKYKVIMKFIERASELERFLFFIIMKTEFECLVQKFFKF